MMILETDERGSGMSFERQLLGLFLHLLILLDPWSYHSAGCIVVSALMSCVA